MRRGGLRAGVLFAFLLGAASVGTHSVASPEQVREDVRHLASDELEGRLTGSPGEQKAADYIVQRLEALGARPVPGADGFRQPFEFTAGTSDAGSWLSLEAAGESPGARWQGTDQVRCLSFSDNGEVRAPIVFAGYGISLPAGQDLSYDSYAGLDVAGKIALVLRYSPEDAEGDVRAALSRYSGLRYKALMARERGALALLVVTGPRSTNAGETVPESFDSALSGSGIVAASIGGEVAARLFAAAGRGSLAEAQRALDSGNPHVPGFQLEGVAPTLHVEVERERRTSANVLGFLPPAPGPGEEALPGLVVLGAHYDHLGRGGHGNSRANKDEMGQIHHGADDNASGVAAVLEIGASLAGAPRRRAVLLALWSGEEIGLLGSSHFVKTDLVPPDRIVAYLNFDMVGRMREERLQVQGAGSSGAWPGLIERSNVALGLDLQLLEDPYLPTDATTFYQAGVPTLSFFTGSHDDYHRPSDVASRVDHEGVARVAALATGMTRNLLSGDRPTYATVKPRPESGGSRDTVRAYTGTIPDYGTEVEGLRLSGVVEGGPAAKAGLLAGDIIVELGGHAIKNIYDYTFALDVVKPDRPVAVVLLRGDEKKTLTIVPTRRP